MIGKALRRKNVLVIAVVMALAGAPAFATILLFENVGAAIGKGLRQSCHGCQQRGVHRVFRQGQRLDPECRGGVFRRE